MPMNLQQQREDAERYARTAFALLTMENAGSRGRELSRIFLSKALDAAFIYLVNSQNIGTGWASNREQFVTTDASDKLLQQRQEWIHGICKAAGTTAHGPVCWLA